MWMRRVKSSRKLRGRSSPLRGLALTVLTEAFYSEAGANATLRVTPVAGRSGAL